MVGTLLRLLLSAFSPQTDAVPGKALLPDLDRSAAETAPADGAWHGLDDEAALAAWVENVRTNFALPCSRTTEENVMVPFFLGLPSDPFADCPGTAESLREELRGLLASFARQAFWLSAEDWPDANWRRVESIVAETGTRDPFLLWMAASGPVHWGRDEDGDAAFRALCEVAGSPDAPPLARLLATGARRLRAVGSKDIDRRLPPVTDFAGANRPVRAAADPDAFADELRARAAEWAATYADRPECSRAVRTFLLHFLKADDAELADALEAAGADPWIALLFRGESEIRKAWGDRGAGWAYTVSEKGWEGFSRHLARARECLERAWALRPDLPNAAALLVTVSGGDAGLDEMDLWFGRALSAEIDFVTAYRQYFWFNYPRWHGSVERMRRFAEACLATERTDLLIPYQGAVGLARIRVELGVPSPRYWADDDLWRKAERAFGATMEEPSFTARFRENAGLALAAVRWARGDGAGALEAARRRTPRQWNAFLFQVFEQWPDVEALVDGLRGPNAARLRAIADLRLARDWTNCLAQADEAWNEGILPLTDSETRLLSALRYDAWLETGFARWESREFPIAVHRRTPDWMPLGWTGPDRAEVDFATLNGRTTASPESPGTCVLGFRHAVPWDVKLEGWMAPTEATNVAHRFAIGLSERPDALEDRPFVVLERVPGRVGIRIVDSVVGREGWGDARWLDYPDVAVHYRIVFDRGRLLLWLGDGDAPHVVDRLPGSRRFDAFRSSRAHLFVVLENTGFAGLIVSRPSPREHAFLDYWERYRGQPARRAPSR